MTGGPEPSGRTKGSAFFPFIWKRLPRTLPISEKEIKKINDLTYQAAKVYSLANVFA